MKRRVVLSTVNFDSRRFSLGLEFLAARILSDPRLNREIRLIKKTYPGQTQDILSPILKHSPHMVAFSCYVWNMTQILETASAIKDKTPQTLIVLGGPGTAGIAGNILESHSYIDGVVMGEGEETLAHLLSGWLQNDKLAPIPGAAVSEEGRVCIGPPRAPIDDLDKIPSPYGNIKPSRFKIPHSHEMGIPPLQTLRGCNKGCLYCYYGKKFSTLRFFSHERIERDLEKIKNIGARVIGLVDPNFFCNHRHATGVIGLISQKGLEFQVEANAEDLNEEVIDLLAGSTCYQVNIGLQSANPVALKLCGRPFDMERFEGNIRSLSKKAPHIRIELDLIYGLPGDRLEDFFHSLDFAFSLPVDNVHFFRLLALPGTAFHEQPQKWGIEFDPNPPYLVNKTCSFFHQDKRQAPIANCMSYWLSSATLSVILRYIFERITDTPSQFFTRLAYWDKMKLVSRPKARNRLDPSKLSVLRYILSGVKQIYPDLFPGSESEYIEQWFKFKRCLGRLKRKSSPEKCDRQISKEKGVLWKRSDTHVTGRFRLDPREDLNAPVPKPLKEVPQQYLLQKDHHGKTVCYEIPEEMVNILRFFKKPVTLEAYLNAPGKTPLIKRHALIMFARESGFIRPA